MLTKSTLTIVVGLAAFLCPAYGDAPSPVRFAMDYSSHVFSKSEGVCIDQWFAKYKALIDRDSDYAELKRGFAKNSPGRVQLRYQFVVRSVGDASDFAATGPQCSEERDQRIIAILKRHIFFDGLPENDEFQVIAYFNRPINGSTELTGTILRANFPSEIGCR
jgi:hypothetical protein